MRLLSLAASLLLCACTSSVKSAKDFRPINPSLYDLIQPYKVTDAAQMPYAYQAANPAGRPLHDDWIVLKGTPRIVTAYKIPLPYKIEDAATCTKHQAWVTWDTSYPTVPGTDVEVKPVWTSWGIFQLPQVLLDIQDSGECTYDLFIGNIWHPMFKKFTGLVFGKELSMYEGVHCDTTVEVPDALDHTQTPSDMMCWWPEYAASYVTPQP